MTRTENWIEPMSEPEKTDRQRIESLEAAVISLHERVADLEAVNQKILSCMKLTAKAQAGLQAQIEALSGPPKPAARKPGGLVQ